MKIEAFLSSLSSSSSSAFKPDFEDENDDKGDHNERALITALPSTIQ